MRLEFGRYWDALFRLVEGNHPVIALIVTYHDVIHANPLQIATSDPRHALHADLSQSASFRQIGKQRRLLPTYLLLLPFSPQRKYNLLLFNSR